MPPFAPQLHPSEDTGTVYTLVATFPSPFPQHKGQPVYFSSVRLGKAYVSFHLMPLYMNAPLLASLPPELKRHMQGKTCFNFKKPPDASLLAQLHQLTEAAFHNFRDKQWI